MAGWTPRSQRLGYRDLSVMHEGVPVHLHPHLMAWARAIFGRQQDPKGLARVMALRLQVPTTEGGRTHYELLDLASRDVDLFLDVIEGLLFFVADDQDSVRLDTILDIGGSQYTVKAKILVDRVSEETAETLSTATNVKDEATENLAEAWARAFGRDPNASDAWDHAIKAVECVLSPIVEPSNNKSTLGSIIAALNNKPQDWYFQVPGSDLSNSASSLVHLLRLLWPNPDRHGPKNRTPTLQEARAVVTLAATLLQWHRDSFVVRRR